MTGCERRTQRVREFLGDIANAPVLTGRGRRATVIIIVLQLFGAFAVGEEVHVSPTKRFSRIFFI
jgi:hypothetical protein